MQDIENSLRYELRDPEYSEGYAESFLNSYIATQIKVIREQRQMTQADLAGKIGTTQTGISRVENVNYTSWNIRTLIKIARAFAVRLHVSFEPFGTLPEEVVRFSRESLERAERASDPGLAQEPVSVLDAIAERDSRVVDIGNWKALAQVGQEKGNRAMTSGPQSQISENDLQPGDIQGALCM
jgi:transcriptional regulator with XRE-family HTH domain